MNYKSIKFIKNILYSFSSNVITLIVSSLVALIVPKLIGVEEYGYWQLYLFYSTYVGFLHFGWNDGLYLRYGGFEYEKLDKKLFFSQFLSLFVFQAVIAFFIFVATHLLIEDVNRAFVLFMIAISLIFINVRTMLLFILQGTNRIKSFAKITMLDRAIYSILILIFLSLKVREYKPLIIAEIIGKFISMLYAVYCCKDIVFNRITAFHFNFDETRENIAVGMKLMIANIASYLIIGIVRFGIERGWNVETFGKVSLTLSISNLVMIFINAIGIIIFPILRRIDENKLSNIYGIIRNFLMVISLAALFLYYPMKTAVSIWLPQYADSLNYMALLFPMYLFEGKMSLLIYTYMKALRKEKAILRINLITVLLSLVFTIITTRTLKNLDFAVLSVLLLIAFKSVTAEVYLTWILKISIWKDTVLELILTTVFILSSWFIASSYRITIYGISYFLYILVKYKDILNTYRGIKNLVKK